MKITHEVREPWRGHLQQVQSAMATEQTNIKILHGDIRLAEQRIQEFAKNAGYIVDLLTKEADLPAASYSLSPDGATITGEIADPPPAQ